MVKLSPEYRSSVFVPEMALNVISKLMNTMVVLLCDHGVAASHKVRKKNAGFVVILKAIHGYFWFLRLLQRLAVEYPQIKNKVNTNVKKFMSSRQERVKSACPSLGN